MRNSGRGAWVKVIQVRLLVLRNDSANSLNQSQYCCIHDTQILTTKLKNIPVKLALWGGWEYERWGTCKSGRKKLTLVMRLVLGHSVSKTKL